MLEEDRNKRLKVPDSVSPEATAQKDAKFLRDLNKQVYLGSDMKLDERLNRKAHYVARDAYKD